MREIKFRAWDDKNKQLLYNISSDCTYGFEANGCLTATRLIELGHDVETIPLLLEQFTGLQDRHGVDIYENDKIRCYEKVGDKISEWDAFVKFSGTSFVVYNPDCCETCKTGFGCICHLDECPGEIEVIGNIHEKE